MLKRRNSGNVNRTDDAVAEAYRNIVASKKMVMVESEDVNESRMSELDIQRQELVERLEAIADEMDEAMIPGSNKAGRLVRDAINSLESIATGGREEDEL